MTRLRGGSQSPSHIAQHDLTGIRSDAAQFAEGGAWRRAEHSHELAYHELLPSFFFFASASRELAPRTTVLQLSGGGPGATSSKCLSPLPDRSAFSRARQDIAVREGPTQRACEPVLGKGQIWTQRYPLRRRARAGLFLRSCRCAGATVMRRGESKMPARPDQHGQPTRDAVGSPRAHSVQPRPGRSESKPQFPGNCWAGSSTSRRGHAGRGAADDWRP